MELLAPAGSRDAFYAALESGADAIYMGVDVLNARRLADNIKRSEIADLTRLAHLHNCKVYLTLNTIVLSDEYSEAIELATDAWRDGVDAVIVQDIGLLAQLHAHLPRIRLHASTQMNVHSSDTLRALAQMGVARVTLSRELSLEQIEVLAAVGREAGVEVEAFGHGALCISYSGQCLFSSLVGRRSANRGMCAQPCRLPYELIDHRGDVHEVAGPYLLSPKDLCSIDYLQRLQDAGVASLKVEGRMKKPAYVAAVVGEYRHALDATAASEFGTMLTDAFNRALTPGYLTQQQDADLMDYLRTKNSTTAAAQQELKAQAQDAIQRVQDFEQVLDFKVEIAVGEPLVVEVRDAAGNTGRFQGSPVEVARTKPLVVDDVRVHLDRLGGTPYSMGDLELDLDEGAGMGFSVLHKARRAAIADYEANRFFGGQAIAQSRVEASLNVAKRAALQNDLPTRKLKRSLSPDIVAVVSSLSAARAVLNAGANEAHLNAWLLADADPAEVGAAIVPVLPRVAADSELDTYYGIAERFGRAVCSTLGQLDTCLRRGIPVQAHWSLNVVNPYAVRALRDSYSPTRIWLSPELSGRQIADISRHSTVPLGTALFGQQEVMITEACVLQGIDDAHNPCTRSCADCSRRARHFALRDKMGYCFPITTDPMGRSHLYNSVPLDLTSALPELLDCDVAALRLDLETTLNTQAAKEAARARRNLIAVAGDTELELPRRPDTVTKGHFFRGVV